MTEMTMMTEELRPLICEAKCSEGKKTRHRQLEQLSDTQYLVQCKKCGHKTELYFLVWERALDRPWRSGLTKFPYIEPATGQLVKSAEHRSEVVKAMGYHEAPNGIDERYDDAEFTRKADISWDD